MQEMGPTRAEHVGEGRGGAHVRLAETCEAWEKGDPPCTHTRPERFARSIGCDSLVSLCMLDREDVLAARGRGSLGISGYAGRLRKGEGPAWTRRSHCNSGGHLGFVKRTLRLPYRGINFSRVFCLTSMSLPDLMFFSVFFILIPCGSWDSFLARRFPNR